MYLSKLKFQPISLSVCFALTLSACGGGSSSNNTTANDEPTSIDDMTSNDSTSGFTAKELAFNKIKAYANDETNVSPSINDYKAAGVTGITNETLAQMNAIVKGLAPEDVDSTAALVALTASLGVNNIPTLSAATIQSYLTVINNARLVARSCGSEGFFPAVAAVSWSDELYKAAYEHSQDMTKTNTFSHNGSGTVSDWTGYPLDQRSSMSQRVANYGYSFSRLSENITAGTNRNTAQKAMDSWIASDGHCRNIMDPNVTEVGLAFSSNQNTRYTNYWTQNFGRPR